VYGDSLLNTTFWTWLPLDQLFAGERLQLLDKTPISRGTSGRRGATSESCLDPGSLQPRYQEVIPSAQI